MSNKLTAAADIRRLAKQFESMVAAADVLEQIGSLEQALDERKALLTTAATELDEAKADATKAKESAKEAKAKAKAIIDAAEEAAKNVERETASRVSAALKDAHRQADEIKASAQRLADQIRINGEADRTRAQEQRDALLSECDALRATADDRRAEAEEAEARLAKAQEAIKAMLGG